MKTNFMPSLGISGLFEMDNTSEMYSGKEIKPTIHIQIEYPVLLSCSVGGHTGVLATICDVSSNHSECATIWINPEHKGSNILSLYHHVSLNHAVKSLIFFYFILFCGKHYLTPILLVLLMTSPSFNHWMIGVGVPLARQTSWMLSFTRTPISVGSSDPEILGGTKRITVLSTIL